MPLGTLSQPLFPLAAAASHIFGKKDKDSFYKDYGDIPGLRDQGHKTETFLFGLCFQEREGETSVKPATDGRT